MQLLSSEFQAAFGQKREKVFAVPAEEWCICNLWFQGGRVVLEMIGEVVLELIGEVVLELIGEVDILRRGVCTSKPMGVAYVFLSFIINNNNPRLYVFSFFPPSHGLFSFI